MSGCRCYEIVRADHRILNPFNQEKSEFATLPRTLATTSTVDSQ